MVAYFLMKNIFRIVDLSVLLALAVCITSCSSNEGFGIESFKRHYISEVRHKIDMLELNMIIADEKVADGEVEGVNELYDEVRGDLDQIVGMTLFMEGLDKVLLGDYDEALQVLKPSASIWKENADTITLIYLCYDRLDMQEERDDLIERMKSKPDLTHYQREVLRILGHSEEGGKNHELSVHQTEFVEIVKNIISQKMPATE